MSARCEEDDATYEVQINENGKAAATRIGEVAALEETLVRHGVVGIV